MTNMRRDRETVDVLTSIYAR